MDKHRFIQLLRIKSTEVNGPTQFCPEDQVIAKYNDGTLSERKLASLRQHLVGCRFCLARIGSLARLENQAHSRDVPESDLVAAKRLVERPALPQPRYAPAWAAAAVVVLALAATFTLGPSFTRNPVPDVPDMQLDPESPRQQRGLNRNVFTPQLITPREGDAIESGGLKVRWTAVQGSLYYDVRVIDAEGVIVWKDRVETTTWNPPIDQQLQFGVDYYVRVYAYLSDGKSVRSEHVLFTVKRED